MHFYSEGITQLPSDQTIANDRNPEEIHLDQIAEIPFIVILENTPLPAELSFRLVRIFHFLHILIITLLNYPFHLLQAQHVQLRFVKVLLKYLVWYLQKYLEQNLAFSSNEGYSFG